MGVFIGGTAYFDAYDLSGEVLEVNTTPEIQVVEYAPMDVDSVKRDRGLESGQAVINGVLNFEDPGTTLFTSRGGTRPFAWADGLAPAEDGNCVFFNAINGGFTVPLQNGQLQRYSLNLGIKGPTLWGKVLAIGTKTSTGNGSGITLPAVATGQTVYAVLFSTQGSTGQMDMIIESDDDGGFPSATTRFTFTQLTAPGYEFLSLAGPITDTEWRASWTLASTPSFPLFCAIAIG